MIQDAEKYSKLLQTATDEHIQTIQKILDHFKHTGEELDNTPTEGETNKEKRKLLQAQQDEMFKIIESALKKVGKTIDEHNNLLGVKD
jgi:hypothetical protein